MFRMPIVAHLAQIAAAALGGLIFHLLGVPAAWLSGSVVAVVIWGALGFARTMPRPVTDVALLISGATLGAAVTPEAIVGIARYPSSLLTLVIGVVAISGGSTLWLTRMSGWRRDDAVLASVPGALSTVLAIAADRNAAVASIAIVQGLRLFALVMLLPSVVVLMGGGDGARLLDQGQAVASPLGLALVLGGGLSAGAAFERFGIAAPILLGAVTMSSLLHVTEAASGIVPPAIATASLVLIGVFTAERFHTLRWASLRRTIPDAFGSIAVGMSVAAIFSGIAAWLAEVSFADALVAFAPGGIEAMMVLTLALGLDPLYVGVHHLARVIGIGLIVPVVVTWLQRGE
jgi:membrane AbrB-like protein